MTATDPLTLVLSRLDNVKKNGTGYTARCPGHDDRTPSLSINVRDDGAVLLHCHAGCEPERVTSALDLHLGDLFPPRDAAVRRNGHGRRKHAPPVPPRRPDARKEERPKHVVGVRHFRIPDTAGRPLAVHVRTDFDDGSKDLSWERPDGQKGLGGLSSKDLPLYGIHERRPGQTTIVVEGEPARDALAPLAMTLGVAVVATVTGASAIPSDEVLRTLLDGLVLVWPDSDPAGESHMSKLGQRLLDLGYSPSQIQRISWAEARPGAGDDSADFVAQGGTPEALARLIAAADVWLPSTATTETDSAHEHSDDGSKRDATDPAFMDTGPYEATPAGFAFLKETRDTVVKQRLSNFTAKIVEEIIADDGASERAELMIEGTLNGAPLRRVRVPTRRFGSLDWVNAEWGARPIIAAGFGNRDRVREAIQRHSPTIATRHVYEHPGWRDLPVHGWCYLHAGGAISTTGTVADVDVALRGAASRILLPDPPSGDDLCAAVRTCLSALDVAPDAVTVPLLGAVYRAPLCELVPADISVFLVGPTGVFKTELSALAMQHVGASFDRLHLPAQWSSTANYLERVAFDFKDAPLAVDDFAPGGSSADVARIHATADRLLRGVGNRGGRGRMQADGSVRPDYPPRGIVIGTGEDAPRGQSLRARMMVLDVGPRDVDREKLTAAQAAGRAGEFAAGLAGFIRWMAPKVDDLASRLPALLSDFRAKAHDGASHARTPEAVAHLAVGWWAFLRFAADVGALSQHEAQVTFDRAWAALGDAAARQAGHQAGEEPARRFLDLLTSALVAGHAHVASLSGGAPLHPEAWGWREASGTGDYPRYDWQPQGSRAGWVDGDDLYLDLEAALAGTQRVSQATGNGVAVTPKTLAKRLHERGYLRSTEQEQGSLKVRRDLEGRRRRVLHLAAEAITPEESVQSVQSVHGAGESTPSCGGDTPNGRIMRPDYAAGNQESGHGIWPEPTGFRDDGQIGQIGQVPPA